MGVADTAKKKPPIAISSTIHSGSVIDEIKNRQTDELVIALCGTLGSGTSTIANKLAEIFSGFDYSVKIIKVSERIEKHLDFVMRWLEKDKFLNEEYVSKIDLNRNIMELDAGDRIALLQSAGNALREETSRDILAQLAIKEIAVKRTQDEGSEDVGDENEVEKSSRRHVSIIDSLKNPKEVELLQAVCRDMFFLFGVLCPEDIRKSRLVDQKRIKEVKATQLMARDKSEGEKSGQQLLKTIFHSEFFVTNSKENIDSLAPNLNRYVRIMMGDKSITPTIEENAMFHAQSAAVRSGCLSRQVGAAIIDSKGNLLSTGCNDVPKSGGGLYRIEDGKNDSRCMLKYGGKCKNYEEKEFIFKDIEGILEKNVQDKSIADKISEEIRSHDRLKSLIEFCRAIHAEMDAITSIARNGGVSLKGSYLFSTTFPCHNCARHIIAAGISKVYYIEPYEKSMALKLHKDAISFDSGHHGGKESKVQFLPFEGVSPRKYLKLFSADDRKHNGTRAEYDQKTARPSLPVMLDTRYEYESKIVKHLDELGLKG